MDTHTSLADARSFLASGGGRYLVSFRVPGTGGAMLEHIFAIDVAERVAGVTRG